MKPSVSDPPPPNGTWNMVAKKKNEVLFILSSGLYLETVSHYTIRLLKKIQTTRKLDTFCLTYFFNTYDIIVFPMILFEKDAPNL